jgi:hypothetical protein
MCPDVPSTRLGTGRALFSLCLVGIAMYAILTARRWPAKAALFPLVTAIPLMLLAGTQLVLDAGRKGARSEESTLDLGLSADVPPDVARRRTIAMFAWIVGFALLVFLIGFPLTVPVFVFAYLAPQGGVPWGLKLVLTAGAWGFFYALFERLLQLQFEAGRIQTWLGLG